jgi:hypothetical protein
MRCDRQAKGLWETPLPPRDLSSLNRESRANLAADAASDQPKRDLGPRQQNRRDRPELALLGVCALDSVRGVAAFDPEDAEIKRALLRNSGRVAAAVLNEKLETSAPFAIGRAESLDCVVLEADAPESVAGAFAERGISVRRAQPASPDKPK